MYHGHLWIGFQSVLQFLLYRSYGPKQAPEVTFRNI